MTSSAAARREFNHCPFPQGESCAMNLPRNSLDTYQPSGRLSTRTLPVLLLVGLPCALLMGWAYAHAVAQISWTPLLLLVAAFLCVLVGVAINILLTVSHSRSPRFNQVAAVSLAFVVWWAHWITTLLMYRQAQEAVTFATSGPWGWIHILGSFATWKHSTLDGETSVGMLSLGWTVECFVMVTMTTFIGKTAAQEPFSEATRAWAKKEFAGELFWPGGSSDMLLGSLRDKGPTFLLQLLCAAELTESSIASQWWTVQVEGHSVPSDATARWLRISIVGHTRDNTGKVKSRNQPVLDMWQVDEADYTSIASRFSGSTSSDTQAEEPASKYNSTERPTPAELEPALTAFKGENFRVALSLTEAHWQHPSANVRADAHRLTALAHARLEQWRQAFEQYHALFEIEPSAFNALQLATTSVMCNELLRGQAWFEKADQINQDAGELSPPRLRTEYMSALEKAGEFAVAMPHLDWLADAYRAVKITDDHFLWSHGLPFFGQFLSKSLPILQATHSDQGVQAWYTQMRDALDDQGRRAIDLHLKELPRHA